MNEPGYPQGTNDNDERCWDDDLGDHEPPCPPEAHCIKCGGLELCAECARIGSCGSPDCLACNQPEPDYDTEDE